MEREGGMGYESTLGGLGGACFFFSRLAGQLLTVRTICTMITWYAVLVCCKLREVE